PGEYVQPNNVIPGLHSAQEGSGILYMYMMIGRRMIIKIEFGSTNDRRVYFDDIEFEFRPVSCEPFRKRSAPVPQNQRIVSVRVERQGGNHKLAVRKKQFHGLIAPHDRVK